MVVVIVLIQVKGGQSGTAFDAIQKIKEVEHAHMVTGPYDIIAYAELPSTEDLRRMTKSIHDVSGVNRTESCIAI